MRLGRDLSDFVVAAVTAIEGAAHHCSLALYVPQAALTDMAPEHSTAPINRAWPLPPRTGCWAGALVGRWSGYNTSTIDLTVLASWQYPAVASTKNARATA